MKERSKYRIETGRAVTTVTTENGRIILTAPFWRQLEGKYIGRLSPEWKVIHIESWPVEN